MATELNTFNGAVDDVIARSGRPDKLQDIIAFIRLTLRECQTRDLFYKDLIEDSILNITVDPFLWPMPLYFRQFQTVKYPVVSDGHGKQVHPDLINPSRGQQRKDFFYYPSGDKFVFRGHGGGVSATQSSTALETQIDVAYYLYFSPLAYIKDVNARPARYLLYDDTDVADGKNFEQEWVYQEDFDTSDEKRAEAEALVTNWLLENWYEMVKQGALAKLWNTVDDPRKGATFGLYKLLQKDFDEAEPRVNVNAYT